MAPVTYPTVTHLIIIRGFSSFDVEKKNDVNFTYLIVAGVRQTNNVVLGKISIQISNKIIPLICALILNRTNNCMWLTSCVNFVGKYFSDKIFWPIINKSIIIFLLNGLFQIGRSFFLWEHIYSVILPQNFVLSLDIGESSSFELKTIEENSIHNYHRSSELFQGI